jgi:hypothetical protein
MVLDIEWLLDTAKYTVRQSYETYEVIASGVISQVTEPTNTVNQLARNVCK